MAIAAIAVGNLTTTALYVDHFQVNVYSDAAYAILVGSQTCVAVKGSTGGWTQASMISISGLVMGNTYYMEAGPVSPGGVLNFTQYSFVAGSVTVPACTYAGTFTSTVAGVNYDLLPGTVPTDIDHFEAIWTKDGSAPSNASLENFWSGSTGANGYIHIFAGGVIGQTIHFFMRAVSTSGGYQNWDAVDNRLITIGGAGTVSAVGVTYSDGTTVQSLQPGQAGADVTASNTAADTSAVNGINSGHIADTALSIGFVGKWWRTTSSAPFPSGGGELPYAPLFTTHDAQINYNIYGYNNWVGAINAPGSPYASYLYVRWTGYYLCSTTGTYTFGVNSDDGANLYVNHMTMVSNLAATQGAAADLTYTQSGTIALVAGDTYEVILEYCNGVNNAGIQFLVTPPSGAVQLTNVGSAYKNAAFTQYANGVAVQALQPAQAGADITGSNTSASTNSVGAVASGTIITNSQLGGIASNEMVDNGNFANGGTFWTLGNATIDTTQFHSGTASLKSFNETTSQGVTGLQAGHTYLLQMWVMTDGSVVGTNAYGIGAYGVVQAGTVKILSSTGGTVTGFGTTEIDIELAATVATPWTLIQVTFVPSLACELMLNLQNSVGGGTVTGNGWFDGVSITDISAASSQLGGIAASSITPIAVLMPSQAGADVTAQQAVVYTGSSESIVPNGTFILNNAQGWVLSGASYSVGGGAGVWNDAIHIIASASGGNYASTPVFSVVPGRSYMITVTGFYGDGSAGSPAPVMRVNYGAVSTGLQGWTAAYTQISLPFVYNSMTSYSFEWICPSGNFASIQILPTVATDQNIYLEGVVCVPYGSAAQWGADVTGINTAADTSKVNGVASTSISPIAVLMPSQAGADVTGSNTAADTSKVNGVTSSSISPISTLMPSQAGADVTSLNVITQLFAPTANTTISGSTATALTGFYCTVTSSSTLNVFDIWGKLHGTSTTADTGNVMVYVDGAQVFSEAIVYGISSGAVGFIWPFWTSISGLSPGSHTVQVYVQLPDSNSITIYQGATTALIQQVK